MQVRAAKGFGTPKTPVHKQGQPKDVADAVSDLKKKGRRPYVRPIDEREAARGKVDFAQVTSWGDGDRAKFGDLKLETFTESFRGDDKRPFYEQLARALELAQSRGQLKVADLGEPFPPFEQWVFKAEHYAQYLADQLAVHEALTAACSAACSTAPISAAAVTDTESGRPNTSAASASAVPAPAEQASSPSTSTTVQPAPAGSTAAGRTKDGVDEAAAKAQAEAATEAGQRGEEAAGQQNSTPPLLSLALACFATGGVFDRTQALSQDVSGFNTAPALRAAQAAGCAPAYNAEGMATSYAQLLTRLGREASRGETPAEQELAGLKLFAHAYCIHATHLTTGMRIGAAAAEKLGLFVARATHFYQDYPKEVADPVGVFVEHVNHTGTLTTLQQRTAIIEELPSGMLKTSLLLAAIATTK